jgi:hypothetical protein
VKAEKESIVAVAQKEKRGMLPKEMSKPKFPEKKREEEEKESKGQVKRGPGRPRKNKSQSKSVEKETKEEEKGDQPQQKKGPGRPPKSKPNPKPVQKKNPNSQSKPAMTRNRSRDEESEESDDSDNDPPTLYYYDHYGKAEAIRMLLHHAGMEFIDKRLSQKEFRKFKEEGRFEFGEMPVLVMNNIGYSTSTAILNKLGGLFGLYPTNMNCN